MVVVFVLVVVVVSVEELLVDMGSSRSSMCTGVGEAWP
jgi:hypothetical protein